MTIRKGARFAVRAMLALTLTSAAYAYDQPQVNLGATSFADSPPFRVPPFIFQQYFQYYSAETFTDNEGNRQPFPKQDANVAVLMSQLTWMTPLRLANATFGLNAVMPAIVGSSTDDGLGRAVINSRNGFGDLTFGPLLQFDPIVGPGGSVFSHRFEFDIIAPTGGYNRGYAINPGANVWAIDPYWAMAWWPTQRLEFSLRLHYLWSGKNTAPPMDVGPANSWQAGQAIHANFAADFAVLPTLSIGINGYWLRQITDSKIDGSDVSGRREQVWALGPGLMWRPTRADSVFLNAYDEFAVRNRPSGVRLFLRYVRLFG
ncbi:MAG: transporter [Paraburkholderia sp.]|jgi:anthranilate 1,2-dioxygenase (deaminating, decarboxylating) large subunit|nr:transporter [Paraburkholderia sp.]